MLTKGGVQQSDFMWHCRLLPKVQAAWRTVLGLGDGEGLSSSFDGCGVWRNPHHPAFRGRRVQTDGKWYHIDQNVARHDGRIGFQGLFTIFGADERTGSLVVVPKSQDDYRVNCERGGKVARGNFTRLSHASDKLYCASRAVQVAPLGPGDVVVWDSRVVHCSAGCDADADPDALLRARHVSSQPTLARLVAYVANAPKASVDETTRTKRVAAVLSGTGGGAFSTHDASNLKAGPKQPGHTPPPPSSPRWALV